MNPSSHPQSNNSLIKSALLALAVGGCHAQVPQIPDNTVAYAVRNLIDDCAKVRATAQKLQGDPNKEVSTALPYSQTRESCVCAVASCDYSKSVKNQAGQLAITTGNFTHFDKGEAGMWSEATLSYTPLPNPNNGLSPEIKIRATANIVDRDVLIGGSCEYYSLYTDGITTQKPRELQSINMDDCRSVDMPIDQAIKHLIPKMQIVQ